MPFSGSNITFSVAFSVGTDFKSGQIQYTGTTAYPGTYGIALADVTETITFYQPGNHGGTPFATSTINCGVTRIATANLPKGTDGKVIQGEYMVMVTAVVAGGVDPGTYTTPDSPSLYHEFCPGTFAIEITPVVDCLCAVLTLDDDTDYVTNGWTVSSRTMTINGPIVTGSTPVYTITGSGDSISTTGQILYAKAYSWNVSVTMTKDTTTLTLTKSGSVTPQCATMCKMLCALKKADGMAQANHRLLPSLYGAGLQFTIMANGQGCDSTAFDTAQASFWSYMAEFGITEDCDDCCDGCSDDDVIQPICGGDSVSALTFVEGTPTWLSIGVVGNTVTIGLTSQAVAYLNAIKTYNLASADGSITVTPTTTPGSSTAPEDIAWDVSVTNPVQKMSFFYKEQYTTVGGLVLTQANIYNVDRKGDIWLTPPVNPTVVYSADGTLRISGLFNAPQVFKANVRLVEYTTQKMIQPGVPVPQLLVIPEITNMPVNSTADEFDVMFYDLFTNVWPLGFAQKKVSTLVDYFTTWTIQIEIEQ